VDHRLVSRTKVTKTMTDNITHNLLQLVAQITARQDELTRSIATEIRESAKETRLEFHQRLDQLERKQDDLGRKQDLTNGRVTTAHKTIDYLKGRVSYLAATAETGGLTRAQKRWLVGVASGAGAGLLKAAWDLLAPIIHRLTQ
jgi:phage gpG-like protein